MKYKDVVRLQLLLEIDISKLFIRFLQIIEGLRGAGLEAKAQIFENVLQNVM